MNDSSSTSLDLRERAQRILGYLNYSSGAEDTAMLQDLNHLFQELSHPDSSELPHERVFDFLSEELNRAEHDPENKALANATEARRALDLTFRHVLPAYLRHHRDLLFHRDSTSLFNAFFVGRVFEVVLQLKDDIPQPDQLAQHAVGRLNDFIGHRPVAVLESQKLEPYEHEWVRPIPVYIRGAGVVTGPFQEVIECAMNILFNTDPELLELARLDPEKLDELAIDPRSFDFDHPVNKRPNHHFGQWDEHHIDQQGKYRRFVIHQVTLDALTSRVRENPGLPREELITEAGAVLAGTILMAAGICGDGPSAHDSTVTLSNLLPVIASYRDQFYCDLLSQIDESHRKRLLEESRVRQQPFGAARQHLNTQLARFRAFQMVHVNLAQVYSQMGYESAAIRHANVLPVASARMICQIECLLYSGTQALASGNLPLAGETLPRIFDQLQRAIECGAVIDPWNILGFDANYGLFQGNENVIRDHRADELTNLMEQLFSFASRVWIAARAAGQEECGQRVSRHFREIVDWWHKFAVHEVSSVDCVDPNEVYAATKDVADLLGQWQQSGGPRDVQYWANHAQSFMSARAYLLAISSLIDRNEFDASMALLIHWLTQSELIPLQQSNGSFQTLVADWVTRQRNQLSEKPDLAACQATWTRLRKFSDYVEANAGEFWNVPRFMSEPDTPELSESDHAPDATDDEDDHDDDNLYRAAYEGMVYRESTDDGFDGSIYDPSIHSEQSIEAELHRIGERLEFLQALTEYWVEAALFCNEQASYFGEERPPDDYFQNQRQNIDNWQRQAKRNQSDLEQLIRSVQRFNLPQPDGSFNSLAEYDRQRLFKESLLDQAIALSVDNATAAILLAAMSCTLRQETNDSFEQEMPADDLYEDEDRMWIQVIASLLSGDRQRLETLFDRLASVIADKSLLYVPLSKNGDPMQIVATRVRQCLIGQTLQGMPRLGLLSQTRELLHVALMMERKQAVRQGAVTEYDELFRIGYTAMVEAVIEAFRQSPEPDPVASDDENDPANLFDCLEMLAESMLMLWLSHSQTLRLTVLEKFRDPEHWKKMVEFIEQFGERMFTQEFLNLSNIRAILHQGVDTWLESIEQQGSDEIGEQFLQKIQQGYSRHDAIRRLTWVLEAIIENFNEYRDYNCTTTQSDNGKRLHVLLDFLRLRCRYDQVCWNLKPVIWAHRSLVQSEENKVASRWRRLLADRVKNEADKLIARLKNLQEKHSIQMATISQRINERFIHPMHVDRLTSLVAQAMEDPNSEKSQRAFELIENYAESLTRQPIGIGFELPGWLTALQAEVDSRMESRKPSGDPQTIQESGSSPSLVKPIPLNVGELVQQIEEMPRRV